MPEFIPEFGSLFLRSLKRMNDTEIMQEILFPYVSEFINKNKLRDIIEKSLNFKIPLVQIEENIHALELFHGPTLAFKDVGARVLSEILGEFKTENSITHILVSTSGDTGGAVARAFSGKEGFEVYVLYPKNGVSLFQESQITMNAKNVFPIEVDGTFDDCQRMVKSFLQNQDLRRELNLITANSINIGRLLPQIVYYFLAYKQLPHHKHDTLISVPCGNLGNLTAGVIAYKMGLPVHKFISGVNENKVFHDLLKSGNLKIKPSVKTCSNAMDVGNPSNLDRLMYIFNQDLAEMRSVICSQTINEEECLDTISNVYKSSNYILDPHSAIGYQTLKNKIKPYQSGIFLATAHPSKFEQVVQRAIPEYTAKQAIEIKNTHKRSIKNEENALKEVLYS